MVLCDKKLVVQAYSMSYTSRYIIGRQHGGTAIAKRLPFGRREIVVAPHVVIQLAVVSNL